MTKVYTAQDLREAADSLEGRLFKSPILTEMLRQAADIQEREEKLLDNGGVPSMTVYRWGPYKGEPGHRTWGVWVRAENSDAESLVVVCAFRCGAIQICRRLNAYERRLNQLCNGGFLDGR